MRHCFELDGEEHLLWLSSAGDAYRLLLDDEAVEISLNRMVLRIAGREYPVQIARDRDRLFIHLGDDAHELVFKDPVLRHAAGDTGGSDDVLRAPMPGAVVAVSSEAGRIVKQGDILLVIESMKLETAIRAPRDAIVETVHVALSQSFERDAPLVTLASLGEQE